MVGRSESTSQSLTEHTLLRLESTWANQPTQITAIEGTEIMVTIMVVVDTEEAVAGTDRPHLITDLQGVATRDLGLALIHQGDTR